MSSDHGRASTDRKSRFREATQLLRHLGRETASTQRVRRLESEVARLGRAIASHEREESWLRRTLRRSLPIVDEDPATLNTSRARAIVQQVVDRVHTDDSRPLALSELAREIGVSANHLSTAFTQDMGIPFKDYLTTLRIQRAQELLRDPRQRISEIAVAVGYASAGRFRAAFRQRTGLSPTRWRTTLKHA